MRTGVAFSMVSVKRRLKRRWKIIESAEAAVMPTMKKEPVLASFEEINSSYSQLNLHSSVES